MLSWKRNQAAYDSSDIHCPNVGPTYDIQSIQAAYDSVDYIHWPNVGSKTNPNQKPTVRSTAYVGTTLAC